MTFLDLFAGIGGFRRGLELNGHKCLGFCELDRYAVMSYVAMYLATDEQREYLAALSLKNRQKEILKDEYRNGEWYTNDIRRVDIAGMPRADCWCFGFPCQDISVAGKHVGLAGNRSGLFYAVTSLIRQMPEEDKPRILFIENVKNLLSINRGYDFLRVLAELDEIGYDAEWQVLNSKDFGVPQNRERVFIIGHLRDECAAEVFPVQGTDGENRVSIIGHRDGYRRNTQIFDPDGITEVLSTGQGGGREHYTVQFCDMCYEGELTMTDNARALKERYYKGVANHKGQDSGVAVGVEPVARVNTLGTQCNQGTMVRVNDDAEVYAVWSDKYQCHIAIRRLTPRECWRLQGYDDFLFDRARLVNSDSQLYKQAGNSVTVNVIRAIGAKLE